MLRSFILPFYNSDFELLTFKLHFLPENVMKMSIFCQSNQLCEVSINVTEMKLIYPYSTNQYRSFKPMIVVLRFTKPEIWFFKEIKETQMTVCRASLYHHGLHIITAFISSRLLYQPGLYISLGMTSSSIATMPVTS